MEYGRGGTMEWAEKTDGELLAEFAAKRAEAAFAELVARHQTLVFNTCRRILEQTQDAEDAAQAVFLVLARQAAVLKGRASLAGWLYQTACHIAWRAKESAARRKNREKEAGQMATLRPEQEAARIQLAPLLDGELNVLPEKYRLPIVLFHLENRSLDETAKLLNCKIGTLGSLLARGRELLKDRLARRGTILSVGLLATLLSHEALAAEVPVAFVSTTTKAALLVTAGKIAAAGGAGVVSAKAVAMADGAVKALFLAKLKTAALVVAAVTAAGAVTGVGIRVALKERPAPKIVQAAPKPAPAKPPVPAAPEIAPPKTLAVPLPPPPPPPAPKIEPPKALAAPVPPPPPAPELAPPKDVAVPVPPPPPPPAPMPELAPPTPPKALAAPVPPAVPDTKPIVAAGRELEGLVGHWSFDEGRGTVAADSSGKGNNGVLVNGPVWTKDGKLGGALSFNGTNQYVNIPNTASLKIVQENSYTLAAWFKPNSIPAGKDPANNSSYAILIKTGWHEGLFFNHSGRFFMIHYLAGNVAEGRESDSTYTAGSFYHVAGVVDRATGTTKIYVNGQLQGTTAWTPNAVAREYENMTWKVGIAYPGAPTYRYAADGVIDDVRIYNRALSASEIQQIYNSASSTEVRVGK